MTLVRHPRHAPKGPVVLVVMDGIGRGAGDEADAVAIASTPTLDPLWVPGARAELRAPGTAGGARPPPSRSPRRRPAIDSGCPEFVPSSAPTARRSGCRPTTTWATAR